MTKNTKTFLAGAIIMMIATVGMFITFAINGWSMANLSLSPKMELVSETFENKFDKIILNDDLMKIDIQVIDSPSIIINYYKNDFENYAFDTTDGLKIELVDKYKGIANLLGQNKRGYKTTLLVPNTFSGTIEVNNSGADVLVKDLTLTKLSITNSEAKIRVDNVHITEEMKLVGNDCDIIVNDTVCSKANIQNRDEDIDIIDLIVDDLTVDNYDGDINIDGELVVNKNCDLTVEYGDIEGILRGVKEDFNIEIEMLNATSNLPINQENGTKNLHIVIKYGKVNIGFVQPKINPLL